MFVQSMVEHAIFREYAATDDPAAPFPVRLVTFLTAVRARFVQLMADWIRVGFCQGNFNSDKYRRIVVFAAAATTAFAPTHCCILRLDVCLCMSFVCLIRYQLLGRGSYHGLWSIWFHGTLPTSLEHVGWGRHAL